MKPNTRISNQRTVRYSLHPQYSVFIIKVNNKAISHKWEKFQLPNWSSPPPGTSFRTHCYSNKLKKSRPFLQRACFTCSQFMINEGAIFWRNTPNKTNTSLTIVSSEHLVDYWIYLKINATNLSNIFTKAAMTPTDKNSVIRNII